MVIYQSGDGLVKMEAVVDAANETIWATQKAIAELFGVSVSGISRHFTNIFSSGELDEKRNLQKMQILINLSHSIVWMQFCLLVIE